MFIFFVAILIFIPILLILLTQKIPLLDKIGLVILAFVSGLLFSFFYHPADPILVTALASAKRQVSELSIALAIPLLLFSINITASFRLAGNAVKGFLLACLAMSISSLITAYYFKEKVDNIWQATGMIVGAYTGGGQNIGAVKAAIEADEILFIDILTYDIVISAVYLLLAMTLLKPIASLFLLKFMVSNSVNNCVNNSANHNANNVTNSVNNKVNSHSNTMDHLKEEGALAYAKLIKREEVPKVMMVLLLSLACIVLSLLIAKIFPSPMQSAIVIISLTTVAAALSFVPSVRKIRNSYPLGMFFILVFCFVSGSMADISMMANVKMGLLGYMASTLLLSILLHGLLCKIFKIDADTFVVTGSAAIMSVPFIPMITSSIKNKSLLFPGIAAGVLGYLLGNYLGIALAYLVRWHLSLV